MSCSLDECSKRILNGENAMTDRYSKYDEMWWYVERVPSCKSVLEKCEMMSKEF